jgi:hypothetical protein
MPNSEKDRLAAEAMGRWEEFQQSLSSEKRWYPIQQFRAFWSAATRYAELTKSDSLIHKSLPPQSTDSSISLARNVSGFQATFFGMLNVWSASFLEDMTRTSSATSLQACDARQSWSSRKAILATRENVAAPCLTSRTRKWHRGMRDRGSKIHLTFWSWPVTLTTRPTVTRSATLA